MGFAPTWIRSAGGRLATRPRDQIRSCFLPSVSVPAFCLLFFGGAPGNRTQFSWASATRNDHTCTSPICCRCPFCCCSFLLLPFSVAAFCHCLLSVQGVLWESNPFLETHNLACEPAHSEHHDFLPLPASNHQSPIFSAVNPQSPIPNRQVGRGGIEPPRSAHQAATQSTTSPSGATCASAAVVGADTCR